MISLWQFCKDEPNDPITDSNSFTFKSRSLANTNAGGIINTEIVVW